MTNIQQIKKHKTKVPVINPTNNGSIIWAIDPYEKKAKPSPKALKYLSEMAKKSGCDIRPVFIYQFPRGFFQTAPMLTDVQKVIRTTRDYIENLGIHAVCSPEVIFTQIEEASGKLNELLKFAKENNAAWIVATSNGRTGLKRMIFGSFAENLLLKSPWPVLFLRNCGKIKRNTTLFPTDFSTNSHRAYQSFLRAARLFKTDIVLFHSYGMPYLASSPGAASGIVPPNFFKDLESDAKKTANEWIAEAKLEGVKVSFLLKNIGMSFVDKQEIVKAAQKSKASMIAMVSTSKLRDRILLGSPAYDVFRANKFPVWMYGPKAVKSRLGKQH